MLRMIICDDEPNAREGLRDTFPWSDFGVECVGTAADGEAALDLALETMPDIILTDVRMPFMDGIELASVLRTQNFRGKIVFISAYDDVSYLRSALRVEAVDYLVKPVAAHDLEELVVRLSGAIRKDRERDELFTRGLASLRERLFLDLIEHGASDLDHLGERLESVELRLPVDSAWIALAARADGGQAAFASLSGRDRALAALRLGDRLRIEVEARAPCFVFEDLRGNAVCLAATDQRARLLDAAEAFRSAAPKLAGVAVSVGLGSSVPCLGSIDRSYLEAVQALEQGAGLGGDGVYDREDLISAASSGASTDADVESSEKYYGRSRQVADRVVEILNARYAEDIRIKTIAKDVYLTPTYLCLLFKQETGQTINDVLTRIRIDRAKKALRDFRKKSYEVCYEVGYSDATHFARTFKRLTGMSPSAYRNSLGGSGSKSAAADGSAGSVK